MTRTSRLRFGPLRAVPLILGGVVLALGCRQTVPASRDRMAIDPPARPGALGASFTTVEGVPVLSWLEPLAGATGPEAGKARHRLLASRFVASSWSAPVTVAEGDGFFANWADFPAIASNGRAAVAHWLAVEGADKYAYSIALAGSADGGATWRPLGKLPADDVEAEHGFVSWLAEPGAGAGLRAFWLDGRGMPGGGPMTLRSARVDPAAGATNEELLDDRVCDCCQTDAAMTADGPVVVYRDRSPDEVRDIAIRRLTPSGWSAPALVHADGWHIEGCPVNGPAVAASGRKVAVAWFTGAPSPRVQLAFSSDSGATFAKPVLLDADRPLGRVDLVLDGQGNAIVSWLGHEPGDPERSALRLRRVEPSGTGGAAITVSTTASSRASGFPRLLLADEEHLMIAWVVPGSPGGRLRAVRMGLDGLAQAAP